MNNKGYYIFLSTIIIGLSIMLYIKKWGELIQVRRHAIYVSVPVLWSCIFVLLLLKSYQQQIDNDLSPYMTLGTIAATACYYWIGMLLFPPTKQIDPQNQFIYFDYYEYFRKQIPWIMGFALIAFSLTTFLSQNKTCFYSDYIIISLLGIAFFTEHKGLMCLLAWGTLSVLIFV